MQGTPVHSVPRHLHVLHLLPSPQVKGQHAAIAPPSDQVPATGLHVKLYALVGSCCAALQAVHHLAGVPHVPAQQLAVLPGPREQEVAVWGELHL
jgi:hypothetical protein